MAGERKIPMLSVAATELVSGVSGDTESKIRELFETARASAPCILFIDGNDNLGSRSGSILWQTHYFYSGIDVVAKRRENAQKDMELRVVSQLIR